MTGFIDDTCDYPRGAVVSLLRNTDRASGLGRSAPRFVEDTYDRDTCLAPIAGLVEPCAASRG